MSTFSVIATPIGNLEDITLRAIEILRNVDLLLCEDTRTTKKLLDKYGIHVLTKSYHVHSKISRENEIVNFLREGKNIALVSDAGTPGISDPGSELVRRIRLDLRDEIESGIIKIQSIPGPSALTAALSIAGVQSNIFTFFGFLPHKKGRETLFKKIGASDDVSVFYESPHRIIKTLESLVKYAEVKDVTVCRELTKVFEQTISGKPREIADYFKSNTEKIRGEFVVVVS